MTQAKLNSNGAFVGNYDERLYQALQEQHRQWFDPATGQMYEQYATYNDCPACTSQNHFLYWRKDGFTFHRCRACSMVFLNPRPNDKATYAFYNSEWTRIYNEQKFYAGNSSRNRDIEENLRNLRLIRTFLPNSFWSGRKSLLEIGPGGEGAFLRHAQRAGFRVTGVELNAENCRRLEKALQITVHNSTLFEAGFSSKSFDVVHMRDVFEHIPNPLQTAREVNRIMTRGGIFSIQVPNVHGLIYRFTQEQHVCVFGFEHPNYWSPESLGGLLHRTGFQVLSVFHESADFTLKSIFNTLFGQLPFTSLQRRTISLPAKLLVRAVQLLFSHKSPFGILDDGIVKRIPNWVKRGSVIHVVARKVCDK